MANNSKENIQSEINGESKMLCVKQQNFIGCEVFEENLFKLKKKQIKQDR